MIPIIKRDRKQAEIEFYLEPGGDDVIVLKARDRASQWMIMLIGPRGVNFCEGINEESGIPVDGNGCILFDKTLT